MYYNATRKVIPLSGDREIIIETGKLAKQADGSVVVKQGNTMLLATVTAAKEPKDDCDFMPLSVEYKEKYASCGRFPGGFLKREARPSDYEILVSRLIDRALRPLFPSDFHAEVFVTVNLISADKDIMPDALAGLAASAALAVADVPFGGPLSEVGGALRFVLAATQVIREVVRCYKMVFDGLQLVCRRLSRTDRQAAVHLAGVGGKDGCTVVQGDADAQIRLARTGRADNDDEPLSTRRHNCRRPRNR